MKVFISWSGSLSGEVAEQLRVEREVDPDGTLPPEERRRLAEHAKRAYMLRLAKRAVAARKAR
jgi:hypothetical protein